MISLSVGTFFEEVGQLLSSLFGKILALLPDSPFQAITSNSDVDQVLRWINWFFPITEMLAILQTWLVCVGLYYLWSVLLRFFKLID